MTPSRLWIPIVLGVLGTAGFCVWVAVGSPPALATLFDLWVYNGVLFLAAAVFFARALSSSQLRGAWICFGVGLTAWALADTYWVVALADVKHPAYPSLADAGYLLALPCLFAGIALCIKHRIGGFRLASWFDGAIGALAAAALAAALLGPALIGLTHGDARPCSPTSPTRSAMCSWSRSSSARWSLAGCAAPGRCCSSGPACSFGPRPTWPISTPRRPTHT